MKSPFAGPFKMLRKEMGLSQVEMAAHLEISQSKLSKIERGKLRPDADEFIECFQLSESLAAWHSFNCLLRGKRR